MELRPRCCVCKVRWLPPEGVDAQTTPCSGCRESRTRPHLRLVVSGTEPETEGLECECCGEMNGDVCIECEAVLCPDCWSGHTDFNTDCPCVSGEAIHG